MIAPLPTALVSSPFLGGEGPVRVFVARGSDPYENTLEALSGIDLSPARGKRVLLKPNAGRVAPPGSGIVTDPRVVAAAMDVFLGLGATVSVGDSPIVGVKTLDALMRSGIAEVAEARKVEVLDLDARRYVEVPLPHGTALSALRVCPEVLEHDLVVSIPVMKTHMHTGVTLAVKNMKGCLWRRSKVELHMLPPISGSADKSLDLAIADLSAVLRPQLSIVDGTVGMEGLGPSAGRAKPFGVVVVSADAFAADAVSCILMGRRTEEIPHLRIGAQRGLGVIEEGSLAVTPGHFREWVSPFAEAPKSLSIQFPNVKVLDESSCSACQSTLLLFLKQYGETLFDYFPDRSGPVTVAIGKGHTVVPLDTLCVGNCTRMHRSRGVYVRGCPPVGSAIQRALVAGKDPPGDKQSD